MARPVVRTEPRELDRRPSLAALAIALVGFAAGVALVRATIDPASSHSRATSIEPVERASAPRETTPDEPPREPEEGPVEPAPTAGEPAPEPDLAGTTPEPVIPPVVARPIDTTRAVQPGRIAYLRCDGAPPVRGPYPCPRDLAFEEAAWAVIDALPNCPTAPPGHGTADVRIALAPGTPPEIRMREPRPDEQTLDPDAVLSCLSTPLAALTTEIGADHLLVSFRFALAPR